MYINKYFTNPHRYLKIWSKRSQDTVIWWSIQYNPLFFNTKIESNQLIAKEKKCIHVLEGGNENIIFISFHLLWDIRNVLDFLFRVSCTIFLYILLFFYTLINSVAADVSHVKVAVICSFISLLLQLCIYRVFFLTFLHLQSIKIYRKRRNIVTINMDSIFHIFISFFIAKQRSNT